MLCLTLALLAAATPLPPDSRQVLGQALQQLRAGENTEAAASARAVIAEEPRNSAAHNALGLALLRSGQFADAAQEFKSAVRNNPKSAAGHANLGEALIELHRETEAADELRSALRLNPDDAMALGSLGRLLARLGENGEAARLLARAHELQPADWQTSAALAGTLLLAGKYDAVRKLAPALTAGGPAAANARASLASLALESGDPSLGILFAGEGAPEQERFTAKAFERVSRLITEKRPSEALSLLKSLSQREQERADWHDLLGTAYYELDQPKQAVDEYQKAISLEPYVADHYFKLGMMFLKHRTPAGAIYVFDNARNVLPEDAKIQLGLGLSYYVKGDLALARQELTRAIALNPRWGASYVVLCDLLAQSHQNDELLKTANAALAQDSGNYLLPYYRGRALAESNPSRAMADFRDSIRLNGQFAEAYYELGKLLAQTAKNREAVSVLEAAIALNPNQAGAHYRLAELYRRGGQEALASAQFAEVRRIRKDGSDEEGVRMLLFTIDPK